MKFLKLTTDRGVPVLINMANVTEVYDLEGVTEIWLITAEGEYNTQCRIKVKESLGEIQARLEFQR